MSSHAGPSRFCVSISEVFKVEGTTFWRVSPTYSATLFELDPGVGGDEHLFSVSPAICNDNGLRRFWKIIERPKLKNLRFENIAMVKQEWESLNDMTGLTGAHHPDQDSLWAKMIPQDT